MNTLFNLLNGSSNNFLNLVSQFNSFRQNFQGDPKQQVQQLLREGKMSKEQFNQLSQMANQFRQFIK